MESRHRLRRPKFLAKRMFRFLAERLPNPGQAVKKQRTRRLRNSPPSDRGRLGSLRLASLPSAAAAAAGAAGGEEVAVAGSRPWHKLFLRQR
jgi:hypothetical protein